MWLTPCGFESHLRHFYERVCIMRVQNISTFNSSFVGKEQNLKNFSNNFVPIVKISAEPAKEPPKTFLEKLGRGLRYVVNRLYYYCFCKP